VTLEDATLENVKREDVKTPRVHVSRFTFHTLATHRQLKVHPIYLITLCAVALRLFRLESPPLWGDEALTASRVTGSFRDLLDILQRDSFPPLHYEIYWAIARVFWLTPVVMRAVPVISGILMVPAMYFLARQIVARHTALWVAAFTACSAYMMVYSRDAKMYPHTWLMTTLMAGSFLWWLRRWHDGGTHLRRIGWMMWVACGLACVGLHATGLFVIALLPIFAITCRRPHWKTGLMTLMGLAVIGIGIGGYYWRFNKVEERTERETIEDASGFGWLTSYNQGRSGPDDVLYATTAYLISWEWPRDVDARLVPRARLTWMETASVALLVLAGLGMFPWPERWRGIAPSPGTPGEGRGEGDFRQPDPPDTSVPDQKITLTLTLSRSTGRGDEDGEPWWRILLWLSLWLVVPSYVFYCKSIRGFLGPEDWLAEPASWFGGRWWPIAAALALAAALCLFWRPKRWHWAINLLVLMIVAAADVWLIAIACRHPQHIVALDWSDAWADPRILAIAVVVLPLLAYLAASTPWRRVAALAQFLAVAAIVLGLCALLESMFTDDPDRSWWLPRYMGVIWPAFAIGLCALLARLPSRALRWTAFGILLGVNLSHAGERILDGTEMPIDRLARDLVNSDMDRLDPIGAEGVEPLRPAGPGLGPGGRRPFGGPGDARTLRWHPLYQADVADVEPGDATRLTANVRVYAPMQARSIGGPGAGTLMTAMGKYYLAMLADQNIPPSQIRMWPIGTFFDINRPGSSRQGMLDAGEVVADVRSHTNLRKIILWDAIEPGGTFPAGIIDPVQRQLGRSWQFRGEETFEVRDHWYWQDMATWRRRVYVRR
jgi:hypothetical protein